MVHWGMYLQASCHALLHHDNIGASVPSLHPFVYFSEALPVTFYNLCPLLQGLLWVRVEHLSLPQVLRGPTLAIQFLVTPGNCSLFWMLTCCGRSSSRSAPIGVMEERPGMLVDIQESWCSLFIAKSSALTPASTLGTEITGFESQALGELSLG